MSLTGLSHKPLHRNLSQKGSQLCVILHISYPSLTSVSAEYLHEKMVGLEQGSAS